MKSLVLRVLVETRSRFGRAQGSVDRSYSWKLELKPVSRGAARCLDDELRWNRESRPEQHRLRRERVRRVAAGVPSSEGTRCVLGLPRRARAVGKHDWWRVPMSLGPRVRQRGEASRGQGSVRGGRDRPRRRHSKRCPSRATFGGCHASRTRLRLALAHRAGASAHLFLRYRRAPRGSQQSLRRRSPP